MSNLLLEALFTSSAASEKLLRTDTGTWTRLAADNSNHTITIPHGYANDNIFPFGWVKTTFPGSTDVFVYGLPYVSATGDNIVAPSWDGSNIYLEFSPTGSITDTIYEYTLLTCIV